MTKPKDLESLPVNELEKIVKSREKFIGKTINFLENVMLGLDNTDLDTEVDRKEGSTNIYVKRDLMDFLGFGVTWETGGTHYSDNTDKMDINYDGGNGYQHVFSASYNENSHDIAELKVYVPGPWEAAMGRAIKLGKRKAISKYKSWLKSYETRVQHEDERDSAKDKEAAKRGRLIAEARELKLVSD
ncbi:MAG: hypothetical protein NTY99_02020 [DPANN group archaeon]|nr:hypothetical protein [DPANN group archaeon]